MAESDKDCFGNGIGVVSSESIPCVDLAKRPAFASRLVWSGRVQATLLAAKLV